MDTEFSHGYHIEVSCETVTSRLQAFSNIPDSAYFVEVLALENRLPKMTI